MSMNNEITSDIFDYLMNEAGIEEKPQAQDSLVGGKILDSFDIVSLSTFLSQKYAIKIKPLDVNLDNFDSVEKIANFVNKKLAS